MFSEVLNNQPSFDQVDHFSLSLSLSLSLSVYESNSNVTWHFYSNRHWLPTFLDAKVKFFVCQWETFIVFSGGPGITMKKKHNNKLFLLKKTFIVTSHCDNVTTKEITHWCMTIFLGISFLYPTTQELKEHNEIHNRELHGND